MMASSKRIKTPRAGSEVTKEWLEVVLSQHESKTCPGSTVKVKSFEVNPGCPKGENFSSDVMRIVADGLVTRANGTPSSTHYSFITKFLSGNEAMHASAISFGLPKREIVALSEVLPAYNAFLEERGVKFRVHAPHHIYSVCKLKDTAEYVLVMQDLKEAGFEVGNKWKGLNLPQLRTAITHLANFHAVSYAFSQTHDFLAKYPDFKGNAMMTNVMEACATIVIEGLQDAMKGNEGEHQDLLNALTVHKDALVTRVREAVSVSGKEPVVCLCHCDFWTNNLMFKYNDGGEIEDFAMIDWGAVGLRSPITDLHYLINTSTLQELRRDHLEEAQRLYYDTFTSAVADLNVPLPNWEYEDFMTEWRRTAMVGVVFGVLVNAISLSKYGRKMNTGTLTKGFSSWFKTMLGKMMVSLPNAMLVKLMYLSIKAETKDVFQDIGSKDSPELSERIWSLLREAYQAGTLKPY